MEQIHYFKSFTVPKNNNFSTTLDFIVYGPHTKKKIIVTVLKIDLVRIFSDCV